MSTLFYDIDGCLHPHDQPQLDHQRQKVIRTPADGLFVWAGALEALLDEFPMVDLVCHSTWRKFYDLDELRRELPPKLAARTVALVPPIADKDRAVATYMAEHGLSVQDCAILEDDPWSFPDGTPNLVIVPSATGLSLPAAQDALRTQLRSLIDHEVDKSPTSEPTARPRRPR